MTALFLSVILTTFLGFCFKVWPRFGVRVLPGILHNYLACMVAALWMVGPDTMFPGLVQHPWFPFASGLSLLFISGFYLFGLSVAFWGMAIVTAVQKMSLVLSSLFAIVYWQEPLNATKSAGILAGMAAIPLLLGRSRTGNPESRSPWADGRALSLILGTFLIAGGIEIGLFLAERGLVSESGDPKFIFVLFAGAFVLGIAILVVSPIDRNAFLTWRHLLAGWILGIPNFFSIYFLMRAIGGGLEASVVFPVNNIGTILLATLVGVFLFREAFHRKNSLGLMLAILGITLLTLTR